MNNSNFYIIIIIMLLLLLVFSILIWKRISDMKRRNTYGEMFYQEDHFREYYSNPCLVSIKEKEDNNLPDWIRYKGISIGTEHLTNTPAFSEGTRVNDRVIVYDANKNPIIGQIISLKKYLDISNSDDKVRERVRKTGQECFTNLIDIIEITAKEGTYYFYVVANGDFK